MIKFRVATEVHVTKLIYLLILVLLFMDESRQSTPLANQIGPLLKSY